MLPPKDPQEEKKHLQEYESMMRKARKLEAKKQKEVYRKKEEKDRKTSSAIQTWENEIIPQWKSRVKDKRTVQLWDAGVPPRCRKKVWRLKIGNQLNISKSTFHECLRRVPQAVRTKDQLAPKKSYEPDPSYGIRRQRRTSSLDVLREQEEHHRFDDSDRRSSMELRPSSSTSYSYATESESGTEANHKRGDSFGGRSAMELDSTRNSNIDDDDDIDLEDDIGLEDDNDEDDDDDTSSQDDEGEDDEDKRLKDPTAINFLNKAIDEDILRTLPSLCVFQVKLNIEFKEVQPTLNPFFLA